jgi:hypothetical protein
MQQSDLAANVTEWLRFLDTPFPLELRTLTPTRIAVANDVNEAIRLADEVDGTVMGTFCPINKATAAALSRNPAGRWTSPQTGNCVSNADITHREVLFIDCDYDGASRPKGSSATNSELIEAQRVAAAIHQHLLSLGLPPKCMAQGMSGNGAHVHVALDAIPDTGALEKTIKGILGALGPIARAVSPNVKIDQTVGNAARVAPLFGTMKQKGPAGDPERPHRRTSITVPETVRRLDLDALVRLHVALCPPVAPTQPAPKEKPAKATPRARKGPLFETANAQDVGTLLEKLGLGDAQHPKCPGCGSEDKGVVVINGGLKCSHDRCASKGKPAGFRTPTDLVAEVKGISPKGAAEWILEQFEVEVPKSEREQSCALKLVHLVEERAALFHDADSATYCVVGEPGNRRTLPIGGSQFKQWISREYYASSRATASGDSIAEAALCLQGRALFDGPLKKAWRRIAGNDEELFLDLCEDDSGAAVRIVPGGWDIVEDPPVHFVRPQSMKAIPRPNRFGPRSLDGLRALVNVASEEQWIALLAFLVTTIRVARPYYVLLVTGEQGSAKSSLVRLVKQLIDPTKATIRSLPRTEQDLVISCSQSHLVCFDNVSILSPDMSDALCKVSTGGGFATRTLYTNGEETIIECRNPLVLNGITDFATRPDLIDRSLHLHLPTLGDGARMTETQLEAAFVATWPIALAAILDGVASAMLRRATIRIHQPGRMVDAETWAVAAAPGLRVEPADMLASLRANGAELHEQAFDADPVAASLMDLLEDPQWWNEWTGTPSALLAAITRTLPEDERQRRQVPPGWPKGVNGLTTRLKRIMPMLRRVGIDVVAERSNAKRTVTVHRSPMVSQRPSRPSPSSLPRESGSQTGDGLFPEIVTTSPKTVTNGSAGDGLFGAVTIPLKRPSPV